MTVPRIDSSLHYHFDFAATMIELLGGKVPDIWDGRSFAESLRANTQQGRDSLVVSQGAWSCQRSVRFDDVLAIRSYHDGYHAYPEVMLFDVKNDPHEQNDLSQQRPDVVARAMTMLDAWHADMMRTATHPTDPLWTVMREGGPFHTCGFLRGYAERLRTTGRANWAEVLEKKHGRECR